jgi:hypothetical protein
MPCEAGFGILNTYDGEHFHRLPLAVSLPHTKNDGLPGIRYQDREQGMGGSLPVRMSHNARVRDSSP